MATEHKKNETVPRGGRREERVLKKNICGMHQSAEAIHAISGPAQWEGSREGKGEQGGGIPSTTTALVSLRQGRLLLWLH